MRFLSGIEPIFKLYNPAVNSTDRSISRWKKDIDWSISLLQRITMTITKF